MLSTESGIVDSHGLMESLETEINGGLPGQKGEGNGSVVLGTRVVRIDPYRDETGGKCPLHPVNAYANTTLLPSSILWRCQWLGRANTNRRL